MEISGQRFFIGSYAKGPSLNLRESRTYQAKPSYIITDWMLLSYVTHIRLIALVVCSLKLPVHRLQF